MGDINVNPCNCCNFMLPIQTFEKHKTRMSICSRINKSRRKQWILQMEIFAIILCLHWDNTRSIKPSSSSSDTATSVVVLSYFYTIRITSFLKLHKQQSSHLLHFNFVFCVRKQRNLDIVCRNEMTNLCGYKP